MSSVNKVTLLGNVGKDPEIRNMQSGDRVASFSVATSESWKNKNGERQEKTQWHNIVVFNQPLIKIIESYVTKGTKVYVEGQLETRKYTDSNGVDKYATEVVLKPYRGEIVLLGSKGEKPMDTENDLHAAAGASVPEEFSDDIPFMKINGWM